MLLMGAGPRALAALALLALVLVLALVLALSAAAPAHRGRAVAGGAPRAKIRVHWEGQACLPRALVAEGRRFAHRLGGFGPETPHQRAALAAEAARLSRRHGVDLSPSQLTALRRLEVALAAQRCAAGVSRRGAAIAAAAARGEPVLAIAERLRLPPRAVLLRLLQERGYSKAAALAAMAAPRRLPPELAAQAAAVAKADLGSPFHSGRTRAAAQAFEDAVGARLRALGLDFETEADLRGAARAAGAPAPALTPDFLLRGAEAVINGRPVFWLDAKDYPAVDSPLVMKSLRAQAAKYTASFGPGAFVFGGGLMCDSATARLGPLLLDGSRLHGRG
jgi:hypothetical protein